MPGDGVACRSPERLALQRAFWSARLSPARTIVGARRSGTAWSADPAPLKRCPTYNCSSARRLGACACGCPWPGTRRRNAIKTARPKTFSTFLCGFRGFCVVR